MSNKDDCINRRDVIDAMKDMYRAAEKWLRDATDDMTKARAESCMASLVEIKLRTEKLPAVQPEQCEWIPKEVENVPYGLIVECSKCGRSELVDNALYHKYCPNCGRKVITE